MLVKISRENQDPRQVLLVSKSEVSQATSHEGPLRGNGSSTGLLPPTVYEYKYDHPFLYFSPILVFARQLLVNRSNDSGQS